MDLGLQMGIVKKSGSWYEVYGDRMGQGRDTAKFYLHENPDVFEKLKKEIVTGEALNKKQTKVIGNDAKPLDDNFFKKS